MNIECVYACFVTTKIEVLLIKSVITHTHTMTDPWIETWCNLYKLPYDPDLDKVKCAQRLRERFGIKDRRTYFRWSSFYTRERAVNADEYQFLMKYAIADMLDNKL